MLLVTTVSVTSLAGAQLNAQLLHEYSGDLYLSDKNMHSAGRLQSPTGYSDMQLLVGIKKWPRRLANFACGCRSQPSCPGGNKCSATRCCSPSWSQLWLLCTARFSCQLSAVGGAWQMQQRRTRIRWVCACHLCLPVLQLQLHINYMPSLSQIVAKAVDAQYNKLSRHDSGTLMFVLS